MTTNGGTLTQGLIIHSRVLLRTPWPKELLLLLLSGVTVITILAKKGTCNHNEVPVLTHSLTRSCSAGYVKSSTFTPILP